MACVKTDDLKWLLWSLPAALEANVLRGAARAAAKVVAEEAKTRTISSEIRGSIKVSPAKVEGGKVTVKVHTKGPGAYLAPWAEYGTRPHFISVDDSQREGRSIRRINDDAKKGSLLINGHFVGETVHHPGARPHPFLRPALDTKEGEALAAAQTYITTRLARVGPFAPAEPEAEE